MPPSKKLTKFIMETEQPVGLKHGVGGWDANSETFLPYIDPVGIWTIGWGQALNPAFDAQGNLTLPVYPNGTPATEGQSPAGAEQVRERLIGEKWDLARTHIGPTTFDALPQNLQDAATHLEWNGGGVGPNGFDKFAKALRRGDVQGAINESRRFMGPKGAKVPMGPLNKAFVETFLAPELENAAELRSTFQSPEFTSNLMNDKQVKVRELNP